MTFDEFNTLIASGKAIQAGSEAMAFTAEASQEALKITAEINSGYHSPKQIRELFGRLIGREMPMHFSLFPPFSTDFGKNIHLGEDVFINAGCRFQDQAGIYIGDGCEIGHNCVLATLNHAKPFEERANIYGAPIRIGKHVWIGANATILAGVTIGDNAIVGAGAVVNRDVAANAIVAGVPARQIGRVD